MRILFVTLFFPPGRSSGTENYTLALAAGMAARGHDVRVICAEGWSSGRRYWNGVTEDRHEGVPVSRVRLNWTKADDPNLVLYDSAVVERWFEGAIAELRPDLVHVTSAITLGLGVLRATKRCHVPLVLTLMDFWFLCPRTVLMRGDGDLCDGRTTPSDCERCLMTSSNLFRRLGTWIPATLAREAWHMVCRVPLLARVRGARGLALDVSHRKELMRQALALPDLTVSHSRFVKKTFEDIGVAERVRHLPNGHDVRSWDRCRVKNSAPALRIGYMGQIAEQKGIHTLIEGFRLADLGSGARLDIWGDPARHRGYAESLRALTAGSSAIAFRGPFDHAAVRDVLSEIDVLVVPSVWYENWPLVIQEAFAAGTPVIATNIGGMAEAVTDGLNGLLFARNDPRDLARQLRRLVDDPSLLPRLTGGIPVVKAIEEELSELEAAYATAIAGRRNPGSGGQRAN